MNSFVLVLTSIYSVITIPLQTPWARTFLSNHKCIKSLLKIISIILTFVILILSVIILLPFMVFQLVCYVHLRLKHGKDFGGFLKGLSPSYALATEQVALVGILFVEYDNRPDDFYEELERAVRKTHYHFYNLNSIVERFCGYYYFVRNQISADEIITSVKLKENKLDLTHDDVLDCCDKIKIFNEKTLWNVIFCNQPVCLNNKRRYAILFRVNHTVTDGYGLMALLKKHIMSSNKENVDTPKIDISKYKKSFSLDNCYTYKNPFEYHNDELKGNENQFTYQLIEEQPNLVGKIKVIAKKFSVTYSNVLITAIITGVSSLLEKKNKQFSGKFQLVITGFANFKQLETVLNDKYETRELTNTFLSILVQIPKAQGNCPKSSFLKDISKECNAVQKSMNPLVISTISNYVMPIIPTMFYEKSLNTINQHNSMIFSNMFKYESTTICGRDVVGMSCSATIATNKGIFASTGCYENRCLMAISGRYDFLKSRKDVEYIMKETQVFIEDLYEESIQEKNQNSN